MLKAEYKETLLLLAALSPSIDPLPHQSQSLGAPFSFYVELVCFLRATPYCGKGKLMGGKPRFVRAEHRYKLRNFGFVAKSQCEQHNNANLQLKWRHH